MYSRRYRKRWNRYPGEKYYFDDEQRPARYRRILLICLVITIPVFILFLILSGQTGKPEERGTRGTASQAPPSGYSPLARIPSAKLTIHLPAEVKEVVVIGYHEAEKPTTYSMQPLGYCVGNHNERRMDPSTPAVQGKVPFFVLNTRGRRASGTSAVDLAVVPGTEIRGPVSGEVTKIKVYYLYGKYADYHLEIMPEGHPEMRVAMIHIDNLRVKVGDRIEQGKTVLGTIRQFERYIKSQIDRYSGGGFGHLHMQVNPYVGEENGTTGT